MMAGHDTHMDLLSLAEVSVLVCVCRNNLLHW